MFLALLASTALAGCEISSPGNPKLEVSVASCTSRQYEQLPPPKFKDDADGGDVAGLMAAWGKENFNRATARDACESRVRAHYAKGQ